MSGSDRFERIATDTDEVVIVIGLWVHRLSRRTVLLLMIVPVGLCRMLVPMTMTVGVIARTMIAFARMSLLSSRFPRGSAWGVNDDHDDDDGDDHDNDHDDDHDDDHDNDHGDDHDKPVEPRNPSPSESTHRARPSPCPPSESDSELCSTSPPPSRRFMIPRGALGFLADPLGPALGWCEPPSPSSSSSSSSEPEDDSVDDSSKARGR
jgi:hypothetical protein